MSTPENFSALFDLFKSLRAGYIRPSTIRDTFIPTKNAVNRIMGDPIVRDVGPLDLLQFIQSLLKTRKPGGINVNIRVLRSFGRWAASNIPSLEKNAFAKLTTLRIADRPIRFLSKEEFRRIFQAEKRVELRRIYLWGLLTGLRAGDLTRLCFEDIDRRRGTIRVINSKSGRVATIPLHPTLNELMEGMTPGPDGSLWSRKFTVSYVSHRFKKASMDAKILDVSLHSLRRTFGSWLARNGVNIFEIQKLLMHSSPLLTAKYYAYLQPSDLGRYVEKLAPATGSVSVVEEGEYSAIVRDYVGSKKT
jgi:integrase